MALLAALAFFSFFGLPPRVASTVFSLRAAVDGFWALAFCLLTLAATNLWAVSAAGPLRLGHYPRNRQAPAFCPRFRRPLFLAAKFALVAAICLWTSCAVSFLPPLPPWLLFISLAFGFRWMLADQRVRFPVCLYRLSASPEIGHPAQAFLGWYGTEWICKKGHGSLYIPGASMSWSNSGEWHYFDSSWSSLGS